MVHTDLKIKKERKVFVSIVYANRMVIEDEPGIFVLPVIAFTFASLNVLALLLPNDLSLF